MDKYWIFLIGHTYFNNPEKDYDKTIKLYADSYMSAWKYIYKYFQNENPSLPDLMDFPIPENRYYSAYYCCLIKEYLRYCSTVFLPEDELLTFEVIGNSKNMKKNVKIDIIMHT